MTFKDFLKEDEAGEGRWITAGGKHILLPDGSDAEKSAAIKKAFGGGSGSPSGPLQVGGLYQKAGSSNHIVLRKVSDGKVSFGLVGSDKTEELPIADFHRQFTKSKAPMGHHAGGPQHGAGTKVHERIEEYLNDL